MSLTGDPFIDLIRKGCKTKYNGYGKTTVVINKSIWHEFKEVAYNNHVSVSEMLHYAIQDAIKKNTTIKRR